VLCYLLVLCLLHIKLGTQC